MPETASVLGGERPNWKDYFSCKFTGECGDQNEAELHYRDFELYYEAHKATLLSDRLVLFRRTLAGKAKLWLDRSTFASTAKLKSEFLKKFGKVKTQAVYVRDFYHAKLNEGEDVEQYAFRIKEAANALGVSNADKVKDNFLRGLPPSLFNILVLNRKESLDSLVQLAVEHLDYISDTKGAVGFESGEGVNKTQESHKSGAGELLREEWEMGLVRQIQLLEEKTQRLESLLENRHQSEVHTTHRDTFSSESEFESEEEARYGGSSGNKPRYRYSSGYGRGNRGRFTNRQERGSRSRWERSPERHYDRYRRGRSDRDDNWRSKEFRGSRRSYSREESRGRSQSGDQSGRDRDQYSWSGQITCLRCNRKGHIARKCRTRLSSLDRQNPQDFH